MKQLFLTSSVHAVAHDLVKKLDLSGGNKLVFINTAAEQEEHDDPWEEEDRAALERAGFETTVYTISGKTEQQLREDLAQYDFIYVSGGNTFYLLQQSQKSGFTRVVHELVEAGKTYIGTSAGSIITGKKCPDYLLRKDEVLELEGKDGYGFVNFTVLPHWGSEGFRQKYIGSRLEMAYSEQQVPLLILTDTQYVHVIDGQMKIVDSRA